MSVTYEGFTAEEKAAMKEHAQDMRKAARRGSSAGKAAAAERDVVAKIAEMSDEDRLLAERVHAIVKANAPMLAPKLWYGQPAYALDGKIVCFFQGAAKFKTRYATLGFNEEAQLDDGAMWATSFALVKMTAAVEKRIAALVKQAVS
ncbi:iron chaperone [Amycolatopsis sp. cmx-11-51]|uniref:iron chaperone n=1 Tax=Amycolatopsis sp. cmx-11-51 TaxID=2785797 RepID=UPI0039E5D07D